MKPDREIRMNMKPRFNFMLPFPIEQILHDQSLPLPDNISMVDRPAGKSVVTIVGAGKVEGAIIAERNAWAHGAGPPGAPMGAPDIRLVHPVQGDGVVSDVAPVIPANVTIEVLTAARIDYYPSPP